MDENVAKLAVGAAVIIPAASVVNLVLGAIACIVFFFMFRTAYNRWLEPKAIKFGEDIGREAAASRGLSDQEKAQAKEGENS